MDRPLPARVALVNQPLGLFRSLAMARRNVLSIIPEIAVKQPMVSGKMGKRWHMVMDPTAIREILLDRVDDYPKSLVTKNLLRPAIGDSLFIAEGCALALATPRGGTGLFTPQYAEPVAHHDRSSAKVSRPDRRRWPAGHQYAGRDGHVDIRRHLGCHILGRRWI